MTIEIRKNISPFEQKNTSFEKENHDPKTGIGVWGNKERVIALVESIKTHDKKVPFKPLPVAEKIIKEVKANVIDSPMSEGEYFTEKEYRQVTHILKKRRLSPTQNFEAVLESIRNNDPYFQNNF